MNKAGGGAWEGETPRETCADRIRKAAQEAGEKARRVFGKGGK